MDCIHGWPVVLTPSPPLHALCIALLVTTALMRNQASHNSLSIRHRLSGSCWPAFQPDHIQDTACPSDQSGTRNGTRAVNGFFRGIERVFRDGFSKACLLCFARFPFLLYQITLK